MAKYPLAIINVYVIIILATGNTQNKCTTFVLPVLVSWAYHYKGWLGVKYQLTYLLSLWWMNKKIQTKYPQLCG